MALNPTFSKLIVRQLPQQCRMMGGAGVSLRERPIHGTREVVGFGVNGRPVYLDKVGLPFPAIRYKEADAEIQTLQAKEKGDWSKLTLEEKKVLYRASFRMTYAEMMAPRGDYKQVIGGVLILASTAVWLYMALKYFILEPLPSTTSEEAKLAQMRRMVQMESGHVSGISSKYDYENNTWK